MLPNYKYTPYMRRYSHKGGVSILKQVTKPKKLSLL